LQTDQRFQSTRTESRTNTSSEDLRRRAAVFFVASGSLSITGSELHGNDAGGWGGGLYGSGTITESVISSNTSGHSGGGIYARGNLDLVNSTLYANTAGIDGAGLYAYDADNTRNVSILQSTIYGNRALTGSGGGIANYELLTVRQSTIAANTAVQGGGIRDWAAGTTQLLNTLVAKNDAATRIGMDVRGTFDEASQYNFIGIITDSAGLGVSSSTIAGNLSNPFDPLLVPLAYNGGPTPTCLLIEDAEVIGTGITPIDRGSDALAVDLTGTPLDTDQRGAGFARIVGDAVDIGATEGAVPLGFQLTDGPAGDVRMGQTVTIAWEIRTPVGQATISLYADPDGVVNGNEFWILEDQPVDGLMGRFDWTVFGLPPGTYTLGAVVYDAVADVTYTDRLDESFTLDYRGTRYVVDSAEDAVVADGRLTLREAVQAASLNIAQGDAPAGSADEVDVIEFAPSLAGQTIHLTGGPLNITDDLVILGLGSELLTVDAGNASRLIQVAGGDSRYVWIEGLRLQNGFVSGAGNHGGAILADGNLVLDGVVVASSRSDAESGGGIYAAQPLIVRNSQFTGNYAQKSGGAIFAGATLDISASSVSTNIAQDTHGGGIHVLGALSMDSVTVSGNRANNNFGGGVYSGSDAVIRNSTIADNYGRNQGGGLWVGDRNGIDPQHGDPRQLDRVQSRFARWRRHFQCQCCADLGWRQLVRQYGRGTGRRHLSVVVSATWFGLDPAQYGFE
jgi:predicted outer membrane repeat protein